MWLVGCLTCDTHTKANQRLIMGLAKSKYSSLHHFCSYGDLNIVTAAIEADPYQPGAQYEPRFQNIPRMTTTEVRSLSI